MSAGFLPPPSAWSRVHSGSSRELQVKVCEQGPAGLVWHWLLLSPFPPELKAVFNLPRKMTRPALQKWDPEFIAAVVWFQVSMLYPEQFLWSFLAKPPQKGRGTNHFRKKRTTNPKQKTTHPRNPQEKKKSVGNLLFFTVFSLFYFILPCDCYFNDTTLSNAFWVFATDGLLVEFSSAVLRDWRNEQYA